MSNSSTKLKILWFSLKIFIKSENKGRIYSDIDPYGEEDWLSESTWNSENIKKGDTIICLTKSKYHFNDIPNSITPGEKYKVV